MKRFIGKTPLVESSKPVSGQYVEMDGERFYQIANYDAMPPFLMSLVSDSDHWMFISSNGGVTAGRKNPDNALFPYYTDDRIHDGRDQTGSKTILLVTRTRGGQTFLWEPFSDRYKDVYTIQRNLYKNIPGNKLIFEEVNTDLGLTFQTAWMNSERFGFVKRSTLINQNTQSVSIDVLDGIQNILPFGITRRFQLEYSTLADGYKKNELDAETRLGIFRLSSIPTDKAEPSEALRATVVWSEGFDTTIRVLSSRQIDRFRSGASLAEERDVKGIRGAYFTNARFDLDRGTEKVWHLVADVAQDASDVAELIQLLRTGKGVRRQIEDDVARGTENLIRIVANADGLQSGGDELSANRHFANVLFNVMRGGIFDHDYRIDRADLIRFIQHADKELFTRHARFLENLPEALLHPELIAQVQSLGDPLLENVCRNYLPLTFGRRHGDPSRPWNIFSIDIKDEKGKRVLNYQGNWRDIFQNWEALAHSFPGYIESMISKFLNASTADGYNPYRVTRDGYEWEVLDPTDAWSYIGYWGDHQIIYLLKLLEASVKFHPEALPKFLGRDIFTCAHVPYRIRPYADQLKDPHNTIDFDSALNAQIEERVRRIGGNGKCLPDVDGNPVLVNLTEKLLVTVLAKLSNFIPEAGIWMNTQRPEWNDANNALVGYGVSMVTLYHLRRFMAFTDGLFQTASETAYTVSEEITALFDQILRIFIQNSALLDGSISNQNRKAMLDALGQAGSDYRMKLYKNGLSGKGQWLTVESIHSFCGWALRYIDHSIWANRRDDGLYHAYNLMELNGDEIKIHRLYEMLEGQVAVLSSGALTVRESLEVLDSLRQSALYRADQNSYILYPDRELPRFLEKNNIPAKAVASSRLLSRLLADGDTQIAAGDVNGRVHFNAEFRNVRFLRERLDVMATGPYGELIQHEKTSLLALYEMLFNHRAFTGRSGTFYKYEGLGSIYWHMVSKLLVAVQEVILSALAEGVDAETLQNLKKHYEEIREGIGVHKPPDSYGAFPTDPYSHTPGFAGVQQPGMTGQVKEDILTRLGELGVRIENGQIGFSTALLGRDAFFKTSGSFCHYDVAGCRQSIALEKGTLAFTLCQVPVVVHRSEQSEIRVSTPNGSQVQHGLVLDAETSESIFWRRGNILRLDVYL